MNIIEIVEIIAFILACIGFIYCVIEFCKMVKEIWSKNE